MKQASLFSFFKAPPPTSAAWPAKIQDKENRTRANGSGSRVGGSETPVLETKSPPPSSHRAGICVPHESATVPAPMVALNPPIAATAEAQQTLRVELALHSDSEPLTGVEGQLSAFEKLRLENIRRNQAFLSSLGLDDVKPIVATSAGAGLAVKKVKRQRAEQPSSSDVCGPSRRSARVANAPHVQYESSAVDAAGHAAEEEEEQEQESEPEDSAVLRYVMEGGGGPVAGAAGGDISELRLVYPQPFKSDLLKAIYSLEFHPLYPSLLLAAGKQGYTSLFKLGAEGDEALLSFKAHSTWVSSAAFVPSASGAALRVLTSSDDSLVKLWDFSKCNQKQVPSLISSNNQLHCRGIYSMDISSDGCKVVTASKDASVVCSRFTQSGDGLILERAYDELHSAVVKSAAWQRGSGDVFASGGQDRRVCVCDVRQPHGSAVTLSDAHGPSGGVHTVRWSPEGAAPLLLSAAMGDASIRVWDVRQLGSGEGSRPLHEFRGHHNLRLKPGQLKDIISPSFLGSRHVISGGQQSDSLSLYSLETGSCVSRGDVGFTAYSLGCTPDQRVAVASRNGQLMYLQAV